MPSVAQTDAAAPRPSACATTSRTAGPGVRHRMLSVTTNSAHTSRLTVISADRMVDGDQLGAVGEGALDLHLVDHLGDAFHHFITAEDRQARLHQLGDGAPVADALEDVGGDDGERLGMVELETAGPAPARQLGRGEDEKLLLLPGREVHRWTSEPQTVRCCFTWSACRSRVAPAATTAPLAMITYASARRSAKSRYCSTSSTASPISFLIRRIASSISRMSEGWMPSVGSSSMSSLGRVSSARPMASICCSPPDSTPPLRPRKRRSAGNRSSTSSILSARPHPSWATRRFSATVRCGKISRPCGT